MRPIRYGDIRQILTSVADTTVTIVSPTKRFFLITGTASQYWLVLPDARTIHLGTPFYFENFSSEFIGVRNSDSTVWRVVPPGCCCECILATQATAAGTWFSRVDETRNPSNLLHLSVDFGGQVGTSGNYNSEMGLTGVLTAGGTAAIHTTLATMPGVWRQQVTTVNSYAQNYNLRYLLLGGGPTRLIYRASFSGLSTAAEEYIARLGLHNNITGGAATDGVYFLYDRAATGDFYVTKTIAAAGGTTTNTTAVQPSTTFASPDSLAIEVNSAATRADFFINKVLQFTHAVAANIPTAVAVFPNFGLTKTAVTADAARSLSTDYVDFIKSFSTPR